VRAKIRIQYPESIKKVKKGSIEGRPKFGLGGSKIKKLQGATSKKN